MNLLYRAVECLRDTQKRECLHTVSHGIEGMQIVYNLERFPGLIACWGSKIPTKVLNLPMKEILFHSSLSILLCFCVLM